MKANLWTFVAAMLVGCGGSTGTLPGDTGNGTTSSSDQSGSSTSSSSAETTIICNGSPCTGVCCPLTTATGNTITCVPVGMCPNLINSSSNTGVVPSTTYYTTATPTTSTTHTVTTTATSSPTATTVTVTVTTTASTSTPIVVGPSVGPVACPGVTACQGTGVCCPGGGSGGTNICAQSQSACVNGQGTVYTCSGSANCTNGDVCCVVNGAGPNGTKLARCQNVCGGNLGDQVCQTANDCPSGHMCGMGNEKLTVCL